jgi:quinoprotein glucose dehydrogenase
MPAFASILDGNEDEIVTYLFGLQQAADQREQPRETEEPDTTAGFVNITAYSFFGDGSHRPAIKPPWGILNAIDLNTGEYIWKIPLGNHPELQQPGQGPTGSENYGGSVVTAGGLLFIGATRDNRFRAFDKADGTLLWEDELPAGGYATPATYEIDGRQYLVIAVSASEENPSGHLRAYALR